MNNGLNNVIQETNRYLGRTEYVFKMFSDERNILKNFNILTQTQTETDQTAKTRRTRQPRLDRRDSSDQTARLGLDRPDSPA